MKQIHSFILIYETKNPYISFLLVSSLCILAASFTVKKIEAAMSNTINYLINVFAERVKSYLQFRLYMCKIG